MMVGLLAENLETESCLCFLTRRSALLLMFKVSSNMCVLPLLFGINPFLVFFDPDALDKLRGETFFSTIFL